MNIEELADRIKLNNAEKELFINFFAVLESPDSVFSSLLYYTEGLDHILRKRTVISFIKLLEKLDSTSVNKTIELFWKLLSNTAKGAQRLTSKMLFRESLAIKTLQSIVRLSWSLDATFCMEQLVLKKDQLAIFQVPEYDLIEIMEQSFREYIGEYGEIITGITVVHSPSSTDLVGDLGRVLYAVDVNGQWYGKLRISEYVLNGSREFECGILAQNPILPASAKIRKGDKFPGARRPGLGVKVSRDLLNNVMLLGRRYNISTIDFSSQYYHLFYAARLMGADFDPTHHRYVFDRTMSDYVERQLDQAHIGYFFDQGRQLWMRKPTYLQERSWFVYNRMIIDPQSGMEGFVWHRPRLIIRLNSPAP